MMFVSIGHWVNSDGLSEPFTVETEYDDKDLIENVVKDTYPAATVYIVKTEKIW